MILLQVDRNHARQMASFVGGLEGRKYALLLTTVSLNECCEEYIQNWTDGEIQAVFALLLLNYAQILTF
jgi:hypothetical protein